jgi:hypothetical protein
VVGSLVPTGIGPFSFFGDSQNITIRHNETSNIEDLAAFDGEVRRL